MSAVQVPAVSAREVEVVVVIPNTTLLCSQVFRGGVAADAAAARGVHATAWLPCPAAGVTVKDMIVLSDAAVAKVAELLESEDAAGLALRVAVRPGGCSGFSYEMFFDGDVAADDEVAEFADGVRVVVDPASAQLLVGASLEYRDGLDRSGFSVTNPNASRTCGCGQSFS